MKQGYLFYFCDGIGSVFDSQVLSLLSAINEKKLFRKVYLILGISNEEQNNKYLKIKGFSDFEIIPYKSYPNYPVFNYSNRHGIKKALTKLNMNFNEVIFHIRGEITAWHLCSIINERFHKKIIPDIRGTSVEEIEEFYNLNKIQKFAKTYNNKNALQNLNNFERISVVSESLKHYLINNYNVNQEKIFVTPSLAGKDFYFNEELRIKGRKELNLDNKDMLIVFSSGGIANWQNIDPLLWLAEKGFIVLNLSKKEIQHKNIINKFVSYSEMPQYLNAADAAVIWRDKSIVNQTASPVKFSEYICCGLPVIANKNVDMISQFLYEHNYGLLLNNFNDIRLNSFEQLKNLDRKKIAETGKKFFGISSIVNNYLSNYSSVQ